MPEFNVPLDIWSRASQHVGLGPIAVAVAAINPPPKAVAQISFVYGKLRQAELRRNVWQFAIRNAVLRPLDTDTMILVPTLWSSSTTYFQGSIVTDSSGTLWQSRIRNNLNYQPGIVLSAWEPYFGPLTVMAYDSTMSYFAGELVYTAPGDGTYNVYASLVSGNGLDPSLSNLWSSAATYFQNQIVQSFPAWAVGTTYTPGQTVTYTDGNTYSSLVSGNVGNIPANTIGTKWTLMPVLQLMPAAGTAPPAVGQPQGTLPQSSPVIEWNATTAYALGAYVMFDGNEYMSILANNTGNLPNAVASIYWAQVTGGTLSMSLIDLNIDNNPQNAPALWSGATTYALNALVGASDGFIYKSLQNSNTNKQPANQANPTWWQLTNVYLPWTTVFTQGGGNSQWLQIGGTAFPFGVGLTVPDISYPIGSGPVSQTSTRNVFRLPSGFLREAPQDPKAGATSWLGAPSGLFYNDWEYRGNYIVSRQSDPIVYWFGADVQDVSLFDPMFCEGLALRCAIEVCEPLTQSAAKLTAIEDKYKKFMGEARTVNGIGVGATEPPEDDLILCRL